MTHIDTSKKVLKLKSGNQASRLSNKDSSGSHHGTQVDGECNGYPGYYLNGPSRKSHGTQ